MELTSQQELPIWQPAWPTMAMQSRQYSYQMEKACAQQPYR